MASSEPNFDDEANYAREHDRLPVRLHWVMEPYESGPATLERFLVASRAYTGLQVSHQVLNCTHCAMVPPHSRPDWYRCSPDQGVSATFWGRGW